MGDNASPSDAVPAANAHVGPVAFYGEVVVTWESAEPVRLARNQPLPAKFVNHYALRVTGLPLQLLKLTARELKATVIEVSSKKRERADYAELSADKRSLLFGFPAENVPLNARPRRNA
jgi:hypothetical protein